MKQTAACRLLANAYLRATGASRALSTIKSLCYVGMSIGSCALMLALIVTHGFERDIGLKMKGISSDAIIESPGNQLVINDITQYLTQHLPDTIVGISASSTRHIISTHDNTSRVLFLRGIYGAREAHTTVLASKIITPHGASLESLLSDKKALLIGKQYALSNNLWIGSELTLYVPQEAGKTKLSLEKKSMYVAGIFSVGLEDYDMNVAYCQHETVQDFYENCTGADQIAIAFAPPAWLLPASSLATWCHNQWQKMRLGTDGYYQMRLAQLAALLPGLTVRSWRELYPDLAASLELEKYAISIVLGLIALVASLLMVCLLFMFIQYKQADIAILRAMGMSRHTIYWLFMRIAMTITSKAVAAGITAAWLIGLIIDTYKPIALPDIYYIAYLPAALEPIHAIMVLLSTMLIAFVACQLPLWQLKQFSIVKILRGN